MDGQPGPSSPAGPTGSYTGCAPAGQLTIERTPRLEEKTPMLGFEGTQKSNWLPGETGILHREQLEKFSVRVEWHSSFFFYLKT